MTYELCFLSPSQMLYQRSELYRITHEEINEYYTDEDKKMMRASSATESRNYLKMTRLEESVYFAKEMGIKKVGIAFCIGLANEPTSAPSILKLRVLKCSRSAVRSVPSIKR